MNDWLVTVLINNYNYAQFIEQAIQSALQQSYPHLEIIVVDDGSTDDSPAVIRQYEPQVKAIFKDNGGQASAFNAGFRASRGEIICILDADDIWLPDKVQSVVNAFAQSEAASVIYHRVQNIDIDRQSQGLPWPPYPVIRADVQNQVITMGGWWPFPPSTGLSFTRDFMAQVLPIPEVPYRLCADTYLADLAPFFGAVIGIETPLSLFRIHNANNWSHDAQIQAREKAYYETRMAMVNQVLREQGRSVQVSLNDHLPYCRMQCLLGDKTNIGRLMWLELANPWEPRILARLKSALRWWKYWWA
ncbi:glycosyltransferase [filamentous cyanobacterium LEGE 11480]|uniref:Glycosyltransferase n=1 Tax=Romeriopsis navalis LEGE 11480 TaxID=2777977 RepID=A0A928Z3R7_9CYAN|nr:glycosyltransferase [Romeriopsis navalis]MBE9029538.1 glycosyltransferase [Romeriopsis navalis LEGE 11480]